jgi:hypothetical protein
MQLAPQPELAVGCSSATAGGIVWGASDACEWDRKPVEAGGLEASGCFSRKVLLAAVPPTHYTQAECVHEVF